METEPIMKTDFEGDTLPEPTIEQDTIQQPSDKNSMPLIAGILLLLAGVFALLSWISVITFDISLIDISQYQQFDTTITEEQIRGFLVICGIIGCVLSVFPLLGGILSLKRKMWGIALAGGILGLFTIGPMFASSILSLIGLILVGISKNQFQ